MRLNIKTLLLPGLILFLFGTRADAQYIFPEISYEVERNGESLLNPFTGGLGAPQFSKLDFDLDGKEDLVVFDRAADIFIPFLNKGEEGDANYVYAPEYRGLFGDAFAWVLFRDYNQDGIKDMFTFPINSDQSAPGIEVRTGTIVDGQLRFELYDFENEDFIYNGLHYEAPTGDYFNVYFASSDISEIVDVDFDGDLDVLSFDPGGSTMFYYQNMAVENNLGLDTFDFIRADECWGRFVEEPFGSQMTLSDDSSECASLFTSGGSSDHRHAGSTVTALDVDGDQKLELLIGDLSNDKIVFLQNEGLDDEAWMSSQDIQFPSYDLPVQMSVFLSSAHLDIDNDGLKDLVFAPNISNGVENIDLVHYYKNVGTQDNQVFEFIKDDFISDNSLDFGNFSNPHLFDYNFDGKIDLLVGSTGNRISNAENDSKLLLYENVGTPTLPQFQLVDDDYAAYAMFSNESANLAPAIGDLDGDGDDDLVVGTNNGYLYYSENIADPGEIAVYADAIFQFMDIDVGSISKPAIFDINEDGLGDLVVGERHGEAVDGVVGNVNYFENVGSIGVPMFNDSTNLNPVFGGVNTRINNTAVGNSSPTMVDVGDDFWLVTGSLRDGIRAYDNIKGNIEGVFDTLALQWGKVYQGNEMTVSMADIDNDGLYEIVTGNVRGGINFYDTNLTLDGLTDVDSYPEKEASILVYPNPVTNQLHVSTKEDMYFRVFNSHGQFVMNGQSNRKSIDVSHFSTGIYFVKMENGITLKFSKI